ncbi:MAG: hypothetical protein ABIQ02_15995, partial [Saprospiraceae bacterium]
MISKITEIDTLLNLPPRPGRIWTIALSVLLVLVTGICVFSPALLILRQLTDYTFYIMIGMMVLGFSAFLFRQERIMILSLLCCCVLCLHLKGSANQ